MPGNAPSRRMEELQHARAQVGAFKDGTPPTGRLPQSQLSGKDVPEVPRSRKGDARGNAREGPKHSLLEGENTV